MRATIVAVTRAALLTVCLCVLTPTLALAQKGSQGNPAVYPPNAKPFGLSYAEWSAKQWQWAYSLPIDKHPLFDTADVSEGQSGPVWFLGGTFTTTEAAGVVSGVAVRDCVVPTGTALFIPILDVEMATAEGNGDTEEELRAAALSIFDTFPPTVLACEIDGVPVKNVEAYRFDSPLYTWGPLPTNSVLEYLGYPGITAGMTSQSVADGYYLMLKPLSVGRHDIHFTAEIVFSTDPLSEFTLDITYHITAKPRK